MKSCWMRRSFCSASRPGLILACVRSSRLSTERLRNMSTSRCSSRVASSLEGEWSTKQFYIEYNGFLSNHLSHGVIALDRLGVEEKRIGQFVRAYEKKLEPASEHREDSEDTLPKFGERKQYYQLVDYYEKEIEVLGCDGAITKHFEKMAHGLCGSAFHGLIHLGYGYAAGANRLVAEGLAYLHHSVIPMSMDFEEWKRNGWETEIVDATSFDEYFDSIGKAVGSLPKAKLQVCLDEHLEFHRGSFQNRMRTISKFSLGDIDLAGKLVCSPPHAEWIVDALMKLFVATCTKDSCDFFLLHGVTSAWALAQFLHLVPNKKYAHYCFMNAILGVYVVQGFKPVDTGRIIDTCDEAPNWDTIKAAILAEDRDEHAFKMLQIAYERFHTTSQANPNMKPVHKQAAQEIPNLKYNFAP